APASATPPEPPRAGRCRVRSPASTTRPRDPMFFRNLTLFRFPVSLDLEGLEDALAAQPLKPVGPLELSSRGFVPTLGRDSEAYAQRIGDAAGVGVGGEAGRLPAAVVNDMLAGKLDEAEEREGRRPGGRARKRMKDELVHELLPRAFV